MARSVAWRRTCNDLVCWRQTESLNATIYILRETGPTGFLLKEEGEQKHFKVYLGDPHTCTCPQFKKDKDLCKHICWLILKKFRVPQTNPITWQLGLVEREINEILFGVAAAQKQAKPKLVKEKSQTGDGRPALQQRDIGQDDVCPICQDELLSKHLPVTYCKFGCGNSIHIKCMKIWADHQTGLGEKTIKCPFCREDFGPITLLKQESRNATGPTQGGRMDRHLGMECQSCHLSPIEGKCYRCSVCANFCLCQACFNTATHTQHPFEYRHKRNQRWKTAQRMFGSVLPQAVANSLLNRELSESDYDLLMQLDNNTTNQMSDIPESVVQSFPLEKVREHSPLLAPGMQCRVCLRGYIVGQLIRKLPRCKHKFHKDCIDGWLLHSHPTCPVDGQVVWDPISAEMENEGSRPAARPQQSEQMGNRHLSLEIPGIGIARQTDTLNNRGNSVARGGGRRKFTNRPQRPNGTQEIGSEFLRASFTLNGLGLGGSGEQEGDTTSVADLPGSRLLGRAQAKRTDLNKRLAISGHSPSRGSNQSQRLRGGVRGRSAPQSTVAYEENDIDLGNVLEAADNVGRGFEESPIMTPTQRVILNHLALLQNPEENVSSIDAVRDAQSTTPGTSQRIIGLRNSVHSNTDVRSPFVRDLPPLIESDQENGHTADTDPETMSLNSSFGRQHHSFRQRIRQDGADVGDVTSDRGSAVSVRSTPASFVTPQQLDVQIDGINAASSTLGNGRIAGNIRQRVRKPDQSIGTNPSALFDSDQSGSKAIEQEARLFDRLQQIEDLYLQGNCDESTVSSETTFISHPGLPPRPSRRQFGKYLAARPRVRESQRKRNVSLGLDGNSFGNMTLRDLL